MKVRYKLLCAMAFLVLFMAGAFLTLSHVYVENLFVQYGFEARKSQTDQLASIIAYYYERNDQSWQGIGPFLISVLHRNSSSAPNNYHDPDKVTIVDAQGLVVTGSRLDGSTGISLGTSSTIQSPITAGGQRIGTLYVHDRDLDRLYAIEINVLHSMTVATGLGVLIATVAALLIGAWLTRVLTRPLRHLTQAIQQLAKGNLASQAPVETRDEFGQVAAAFNDMAKQLARIEEARRHLVADVAHELRTPLTIIQGQLELVQQGVSQPGPEALLPIQDEVARLTGLVSDLHQLSLAEAGRLPLAQRPTDVAGLLQRIVDNFQIEAEERGLNLSLESPCGELVADVDPHRMTQVFVNLLGNAMRYTPADGRVTVLLNKCGSNPASGEERIQASFTDTGPGISQEHLPHVFERFYRGEEDRSRESGGMGLGLAIAKSLVEAHHGSIEVRSVLGQGATFIVHLPRFSTSMSRSGS